MTEKPGEIRDDVQSGARPAPLQLQPLAPPLTVFVDIMTAVSEATGLAAWGAVVQVGSVKVEVRRNLCQKCDHASSPLRAIYRATLFATRLMNGLLPPTEQWSPGLLAIRAPSAFLAKLAKPADRMTNTDLAEVLKSQFEVLAFRGVKVFFSAPASKRAPIPGRPHELALLAHGIGDLRRCMVCNAKFESAAALALHIREAHPEAILDFDRGALFELATPRFSSYPA